MNLRGNCRAVICSITLDQLSARVQSQIRNGARCPGRMVCHNVPHLGQATHCSFGRNLLRDFGISSGWLKSTLLCASWHALHMRAPGLVIERSFVSTAPA